MKIIVWFGFWVLLCFAGLSSCTPEVPEVPLPLKGKTEGGMYLDSKGRQLLLRGFNARVKGVFDVTFDDGRKKLQEIPPLQDADCKRIGVEMGLNLLRLPINWSGIEPKKGSYNQAYLDRVFAVVRMCYKYGVYTLLDFHQDAYSKEIGEDGAPLWAIVPKPDKLLEGPLTDLAARRTSPAVLAAFKSFFLNKEGLQDSYAAMAAHVAKQAMKVEGVVGIEIMNEPVLLGVDGSRLHDFHTKVGKAIRKVAPTMTLFFEPDTLRNLVDTMPVEQKFSLPNGVYSPHIYTQVFQDNWKSEDVKAIRNSVLNAKKEADKHGVPLFVGEFGNDPKLKRGMKWLRESLALFDEVGASWAIWLYEEWSQGSWGMYGIGKDGKRGEIRKEYQKLLSRPFPSRLAGRLKSMKWDSSTSTLQVDFASPMEEKHVFTVPSLTYPKGINVTCGGKEIAVGVAMGRTQFLCSDSPIVVSPAK